MIIHTRDDNEYESQKRDQYWTGFMTDELKFKLKVENIKKIRIIQVKKV
jgi:hypothetical protein